MDVATHAATAATDRLFDYGVLGIFVVICLIAMFFGGRWFMHKHEESQMALARAHGEQITLLKTALTEEHDERIANAEQCRQEREASAQAMRLATHDFVSTLTGFQMNQQTIANLMSDVKDAMGRIERAPAKGA